MRFLKWDIWNEVFEMRYLKWDIWNEIFEMRYLKWDIWNEIFGMRCLEWDVWNEMFEVRYLKWDFWNEIFEMRYLKLDIWNEIFEMIYLKWDFWNEIFENWEKAQLFCIKKLQFKKGIYVGNLHFSKFSVSQDKQHEMDPGPLPERGSPVICTGFYPFSSVLPGPLIARTCKL
jgi:hypothetical protein